MGGLPSCKCNKESDMAEINFKTEGDMRPKEQLVKEEKYNNDNNDE